MPYLARLDLVIAEHTGHDRKAGGIGARPPLGALTEAPAFQIPLRSAAAVPAVRAVLARVALVEHAGALLNHEHVTIAVAARRAAALDLDRTWTGEGVRARIAFVGIPIEGDSRHLLVLRHDVDRDAVLAGSAVVRMEPRAAHQIAQARGPGCVHRRRRNVLVPVVVRR